MRTYGVKLCSICHRRWVSKEKPGFVGALVCAQCREKIEAAVAAAKEKP